MTLDRRSLLTGAAATAAAAVTAATVPAEAAVKTAPPDAVGLMYDTTLCIGCKTCVVACREANNKKPDTSNSNGLWDAPLDLNGQTKNVIKLYKDPESPERSYFKAQCMHCVDPACARACMLHSLHKDETTGVVAYDPFYCVGCRYCQMACPFNVPKFEFAKAVPRIVKCELCRHRVKDAAVTAGGFTRFAKGQRPACCEVCPREAVIDGHRDELLAEAKRRIAANPGRYYQDRVYGENDLGGTQVLYLSHVPFAALGLPEYGDEPTSKLCYAVQDGIYWKLPMVAPAALFVAMAAVTFRNRRGGGGAAPAGKGDIWAGAPEGEDGR
jgi:Fe-S-cluster-containing dehydrogenase component